MLPLAYAVRNLYRDRARLVQTVGGSGLVVLLAIGATAVTAAMEGVLGATGSARNVILLGAGSEESVLRSEVSETAAGVAEASLRGLVEKAGLRAVSPEIHHMTFVGREGQGRGQALVRGVTARATLVYPKVQLVEGRFPGPGEAMVGRLAWKRLGFPPGALAPGAPITIDDAPVTVSGVFAAPGTVMESEVWCSLSDLKVFAQRDSVSCVVVRLDTAEPEDVDLLTKQRLDLELAAVREDVYYADLADFYSPLRTMTWVTAGLVAAGAVFGGINTLYAAFASRIREIATLQAIGFGRGAILLSFIQESLLATLAGTLAATAAAALLLDGRAVSFSIGSFNLQVTPAVALTGLLTGLGLGLVGALPAAWRCLVPPLPTALRAP